MEFDANKVYATIIKEDDGFHVVDEDGTVSDVCKIIEEGKTMALPKNASNRKWFNVKRAESEIAEKGHVDLYYKATKTIGSTVPNAALIKYLSEEDQAEYNAIIARAKEAMLADRKQPMSDVDKLKAKIAKLTAQLAELDALAD